ncbi:MAG: tyrosine-type recombinase/integrase [Melioribacteraceae bacterium]|nr:MAG: tyrosine-type recombinase/integrase [Melioribacteraceae bacterium]
MFIFKRGNVYHVEFLDPIQNKIRRISSGSKLKSEAIKFASNLEAELTKPKETRAIKFSTFKKEYTAYAEHRYTESYIRSIDLSFRQLINYFGDKQLTQLTKHDVEKFIGETYSRAKYSAHLYNRTLKAAMNKAIEWELLVKNPFKGVKTPKTNRKYPVFLTDDQFNRILAHTNNVSMRNIFIMAYNTGLRLGELVNLTWSAINMVEKIIVVGNHNFTTKSKAARTIPMNSTVYYLLKDLYKDSVDIEAYVFTNCNGIRFNNDHVSKSFKKAIIAAELNQDVHFHTLRHSFASKLVQKGASIYVIKELLGHSDVSTTQIYSHLNRESLKNAIELLSND